MRNKAIECLYKDQVDFAISQLKSKGEFHPFAAFIQNGNVVRIAEEILGLEFNNSGHLLNHLAQIIISKYQKGVLKVSVITTNIEIIEKNKFLGMKGIFVVIDTPDGPINTIVPYKLRKFPGYHKVTVFEWFEPKNKTGIY